MALDALSWELAAAAAVLAVTHTLLGPDHILPFVMMARTGNWSRRRTLAVTSLCGAAHVGASILLGVGGLALGAAIGRIEGLESGRGDLAAWCLVAFGLAWMAWGLRKGWRRREGLHPHPHGARVHIHRGGSGEHAHAEVDGEGERAGRMRFWALFAVFALGPCEPMIPLFILPASRGRWGDAVLAAAVFSVLTIVSMAAAVTAGLAGLRRLSLRPLERWSHALAGGIVAATGLAVIGFGL